MSDVIGKHLVNKKTRSCGCLMRELTSVRSRTHGMTTSPEHVSWSSMKTRCTNDRIPSWPNYGGRGIYVCPRWMASFVDFLADMGPMPRDKSSIDRRDSDGSYTCGKCDDCIAKGVPMNCRWADTVEQANNVSRNRMLTYNGETMTVTDWTRRLGFSAAGIFSRLDRGWTVEQSLGTPPLGRGAKKVREEARGTMAPAAPDHHVSLPTKQRNPNPRKAWKHIPAAE